MKIIVVGAGIAGLAAAHYLSKKGHKVEIYEASNRAGGRAITLKRPGNGDRCDVGSQYFHSNYKRALKLIHATGLSGNLRKISGYTRFFNGTETTVPFDVHHRYPWIKPAGITGNLKMAAFLLKQLIHFKIDPYKINLEHPSDQQSISQITSDPDVINYIVRPLTLAGGLTLPETDKISQLHLIRLIKIIIFSDYLCLTTGISSLHERLANNLTIHYDSPVQHIIEENNAITGIQLSSNDKTEKADHVVIAVPPPCAVKMLPEDWQQEAGFLNDIQIPSFTLINLFLDRSLEKNIWSYIMPDDDPNIMLCTDAARKNPLAVPSGKSILQAWPCYPRSQMLEKQTDEEIIKSCITGLETYFPKISGWIDSSVVTRHQYGVPQFNVGHNQNAISFLTAIKKRNGISFCGDYLSGGYMESALWSAENVANQSFI